jgi:small subunit ribosomal protein S6
MRRGALNVPARHIKRKGKARMALYEHVFLARQDISQAQVDALTKEFTTVIEEGGGKVSKTEYWGLKSLTYKIKKSRKAHYTLFNIDAPASAVTEMERRMGLSTDVIRYMTIRVDELETEPSAMLRKSDRDDRRDGDRGGDRGGPRGPRGGMGGFRGGDRGDRPPREGGFRADRGDRPPRDDRPPREGGFRSDRPARPVGGPGRDTPET